jgi:hypothetical protein
VIDLDSLYRELVQPRTPVELAATYRDACRRGHDDSAQPPSDRPAGLLASSISSLTSLAIATHAPHLLPRGRDCGEQAGIDAALLTTIEQTASSCLCCCHLALVAYGRARGYTADEYLPVVYELARLVLQDLSADDEPDERTIARLSQDTGCWVAAVIDALDRDDSTVTDALTDALARLLVINLFAELASLERRSMDK